MSPSLAALVALLSITSVKTEATAPMCPVGAVIDRIEGDRVVVVLGSDGVRSIAASQIDRTRRGPVREGMRVRRARDGRCVADAPDAALDVRVRGRLRALMRR